MSAFDGATVLIVDEDPRQRERLSAALAEEAGRVLRVQNETEAINCLMSTQVDILIAPLRSPHVDGGKLLRLAQDLYEHTAVILMVDSDALEADSAVRLMLDGANDTLTRPVNTERLRAIVRRILRQQEIVRERDSLRTQLQHPAEMLGFTARSPKMQAVAERILQLAAAPNTTVLICGESGTGKEVAARALHFHSPRRRGPFVPFNCASVPETLIESELFGHEAGAFTGAQTRRRGRFELADGGTLLLDEVGELSLQAQAKLLRVLETRQFERVGGERPIRVDVRIVAATNRDLEAEVRAGRFRADLYHRLRVATVELPPLRERVEDIPLLVQAFIEEFSAANKKNVRGITSRALRLMERYPWYGNVRELRNAVEAMVVVAQSEVLDVEDLPVWLTRAVTRDSAAKADGSTQQRGHNPDSRLRGNELEGDRTGSDPSNASVDRRESDGGRAHSRNRSANAVPQAEGVRTMNHWETTWASVGLAAGAGVRLQVAEVEAPTLWSAQVAPDHRPGVGDFLGPGIAVVVLAALGWLAWRWSQTRATRGLRRAVRRARRFNEQTREMTFPHPVPEMEAERRADIPRSSASSQEPEERRSVRSGRRQRAVRERAPSERNEEEAMEQPVLDPRDLDALKRLEAIQQEWDPKEPRTAYRRLEDFIRRYLFETFGVRAFGMRTSELLAALPRSTEDALFDYVAEILTTCELAELPRHRPDRREVEHLIRLAREVVLLQARTARRGDRSPKQS